MLLTRAPCAHFLYCYRKLRTRLACVKHAASVRSEPGSNSRLKLVVLKIKIPACGRDVSFRTNFLMCRLVHSKTKRVLARLIQLSKSRPPVRQAGYSAIADSSTRARIVKRAVCGNLLWRVGRNAEQLETPRFREAKRQGNLLSPKSWHRDDLAKTCYDRCSIATYGRLSYPK